MPPKTLAKTAKTSTRKQIVKQVGRTKATPKHPSPVSDTLRRFFTSLCAQIDGGHFNNAIKTCDKILRLDPHDEDALQTKLFLLLQTEQYGTALMLISDDGAFAGYDFEKAYSLYRLHRESEAVDVLGVIKEKDDSDNRGVRHLEAQLAYRQDSYQTSFDLYNQLLDTAEPRSEEQSDILTNLEASQKHLDFINIDFLHVLDTLPSSLTSGLESAPPPQPLSSLATALAVATVTSNTRAEDDSARKVNTVRKRVPAGVVPGVTPPPDPERWLKKSERSTFGQGSKRRRGGGGATQGLVESGGTAGHQGGKSGGTGRGKKKK
ncbi:hypothetical protein BKA93DRAFT_825295 [Sparassis latifolia]|uniref:Signal recognition particle subunit SRP72 n=1 Tax=Sparassis crispa TaxID=139825 RepID=A0A401GFM4_9APHY|nr:hypothetical protein SCP_0306240 [Sparassis crispa]GBE80903.1 hypothetical protein SCP_0306240 [Sparassis crispa]